MELASEIPPLLLLPYLHDWVEQARAPGPDRARTSSGGLWRRFACARPMRRVSRSASSVSLGGAAGETAS